MLERSRYQRLPLPIPISWRSAISSWPLAIHSVWARLLPADVTSGIISALARTQVGIADYGFFIQTDAAINPGNSGGPLVTMDGKLAGINTAIYSRSGGSVGIGFAIPANMVASVLSAEQHGGHRDRPWIGASGQAVSADLAEAMGLDHPMGVIIDDIYPGGPAAEAGMKRGDVVIAVNGKQVEDPGSLRFRLATLDVGAETMVSVLRNHKPLDLRVRLVAPPEIPAAQKTELSGGQPLAGAVIANLSPAIAEQLQLVSDWKGVVIYQLRKGTTAARFGLAAGDIILAVNGKTVATVDELQRALAAAAGSWQIAIRRRGETRTLQVE